MMTGVGVILGTAAYTSPEQAKGRDADKRSDIWGFGCVLYEMLTGRRAFDGEDMTDVLGAVVRLEPDWKAIPSDVTPAVRTLLRSCLVKDRRQRVGDMSEIRQQSPNGWLSTRSSEPQRSRAPKPAFSYIAPAQKLPDAAYLGGSLRQRDR
jgi:serine/threonine protein kinase